MENCEVLNLCTCTCCAFCQGLYKDGERFGPGVATYVDGTCDIGLWYRERLIKLCTSVGTEEFSPQAHGYRCDHDEHRKRIPKVVRVRSRLESATRSAVSLHMSPEPMNCGFESDPDDIIRAVVSDLLPVSSLAADLQSFDEAFFTCSKSLFYSAPTLDYATSSNNEASGSTVNDSVDANLASSRNQLVKSVLAAPALYQDLEQETEECILAWNNTASCIAMQVNILRHRSAQSAVGFDVNSVVMGDRGLTMGAQGVIELASERFILAADAGDLTSVNNLLNSGDVNVDVSDSTGRTALFAAVVCVHFGVKLLLFLLLLANVYILLLSCSSSFLKSIACFNGLLKWIFFISGILAVFINTLVGPQEEHQVCVSNFF